MASLLAVCLAATVGLLSTALPAAAETADENRFTWTYRPAGWAWVDASHPLTSHYNPSGDVPVGAWREEGDPGIEYHLGRSYLSYDLTDMRGKHIYEATLVGAETTVNDCAQARQVELWETESIGPDTTWANKPRELARLKGPASAEGCPASRITWDIADRLRAAIASGAERFTLELRVSEEYEGDVHFGRRFASNAYVQLVFNTPPLVPDQLYTSVDYGGTRPCERPSPGTHLRSTGDIELQARVRDPDLGTPYLVGRFAVWPVDDPTARLVREGYGRWPARVEFQHGEFTDGRTYGWAVQAFDGSHESAWTEPCYFTVDNTPPNPPLISSEEYPSNEAPGTGGPGVPGTFTMRVNGDTDVKYFRYSWYFPEVGSWSGTVAADATGTASVQVTPRAGGQHRFRAYAIDRAGHWSLTTDYYFQVRETRPVISSPDYDAEPPTGRIGIASTFEFRSGLPGVVGYEYRLDDDPPQTVAADSSGVARIEITPTSGGGHELTVRSYDAAGTYSLPRTYGFFVITGPDISSSEYPSWEESGAPNVPGVFRFSPNMPDVVEYVYHFDDEPEQTVEAAADHTASVTWTPLEPGFHEVRVSSRSADGAVSDEPGYYFYVAPGNPEVTSEGYPSGERSGWPGRSGTFTFRPNMPGVTSYEYRFSSDEWQTIPANPDGTGTLAWAPPASGWYLLEVVSRAANGARSYPTSYSFYVNSGAPAVSSADYPEDEVSGYPGKTGAFTLAATAGMPVTEFRYRFEWNGEWLSAPAGADGKATVTFTPRDRGNYRLEVYGRTADGAQSETTIYRFWVGDGAPMVSSDTYPEDAYGGAPGVPGTFTITPVMPDVVEYEYFFSDGASGTVQANPDGTASITWAPIWSGWNEVYVWGRTSSGRETGYRVYSFWVNDAPLP